MTEYRHENKYFINACDKVCLMLTAKEIMTGDSHADTENSYLIKSLYFDDYSDSCLREVIDGVDNRSKFRIRYYNNDLSFISLEKKIKKNGLTKKLSCRLTQEETYTLMNGNYSGLIGCADDLKQQLLLEMQLRCLRPKVIVQYTRNPYVYRIGNVRVTFDNNLSSSVDVNRFLEKEIASRPVWRSGESLLEVKWDNVLPNHIKENLDLGHLQWTSFSKYCACRLINGNGGI